MSELSIRLQGFPEKVHRVADVIEDAFPGLIDWVHGFDETGHLTILIEGTESPYDFLQHQGQTLQE